MSGRANDGGRGKFSIGNAEFIRSAADPVGFPQDDLPRCAFVGRSNVGKSSTLNTLLGRKNFARVSAVPGKTVFVNLFMVDKRLWLVDLPGYGYSKTSKAERERYSKLIDAYFNHDMQNIRRIYMIVDARHKPTEGDCIMIEWIRAYDMPFTIIANKLDKLKSSQIEPSMAIIRQTLGLAEDERLIPFSAEKKTNRDVVISDILAAMNEKPMGVDTIL